MPLHKNYLKTGCYLFGMAFAKHKDKGYILPETKEHSICPCRNYLSPLPVPEKQSGTGPHQSTECPNNQEALKRM